MTETIGRTLGEVIDGCRSEHTILDLFFKNEHGRWYIPRPLAERPKARQLAGNTYLRGLEVDHKTRFADARQGVGWNVYINAPFDADACKRGTGRG